jgi:hypothetical protein
MAMHTEITSTEAADRLALRELFDAYAHCADRRDAAGQKALFTDDTVFAVYMDGDGSEPTYVLNGREALTRLRRPQSLRDNNALQRPKHGHTRRRTRNRRELHDRPPRLHRRRQPQDHDRLPPVPRHLRQDRRTLVLRRTQAHPRLERDAIHDHTRGRLTAGEAELRLSELSRRRTPRPRQRSRPPRPHRAGARARRTRAARTSSHARACSGGGARATPARRASRTCAAPDRA